MSNPLLKKITNLFGNDNEKALKRYRKIVEKINVLEPEMEKLKDEDFAKKTEAFKKQVLENTRFKITERSLFKLESELSSETVWKQLKGLKDKEFLSKEELLEEIKSRMVAEEAEEAEYAAKRFIQEDTTTILNEILPEAFALVREASRRVSGERHYDVQLIGGIALHEGNIAEMATGEGKTLASTCPAYLNALTGKGVHIVTPNDYLAKRDSQWMGKVYNLLGVRVGLIQHNFSKPERQYNYRCDITYGTNNEYGFDYLRDNMSRDLEEYVQRGFNFAIVDEVDSILIDESRTPLIISGPTDDKIETYKTIDKYVYGLEREIQKQEVPQLPKEEMVGIDPDWEEKEDRDVVREGDFTLDEKSRLVSLTDRGAAKIEKRLSELERYHLLPQDVKRFEGQTDDTELVKHLNSMTNFEYKNDKAFAMALSEKISEDAFAKYKSRLTEMAYKGLLRPTYRLSKSGLDQLANQEEIAAILPLLRGLQDLEYETEEAFLEAVKVTLGEEDTPRYSSLILSHIEILKSLFDRVNTPILHHVNQALKAHLVFKRDVDYVVQSGKVVIVDDFTGRLMEGRRYSDGLHQALEAKERVNIEMESQTLASVTFQNYFRLYNKLAGMTGTAETEKDEFKKIYNLGVVVIPTHRKLLRQDQPDVIYKSEEAKYNAIVDKVKSLYDRKQPVLVGTVSVETSELISRRLKQQNVSHRVLNAKYHEQEAEIVKDAGQLESVTIATNMAGRGTDIKPSKEALELGGLFILGTERHDSRRIDNQLRGRSGRQGDPGESQFFLSMEDNLLRIFGGEKLIKWMDRFQIEDDMPIEHAFVTRAIANAQKKVEGLHFSARKSLLEYDDIMERQRSIIYEKRRAILSSDIHHGFLDMAAETVENLMDEYCSDKYHDQWKQDLFVQEFFHVFNVRLDDSWESPELQRDEIIHNLFEKTEEYYQSKIEHFRNDYFKLFHEAQLLEVAAVYFHIIIHENHHAWEFPYKDMPQFKTHFEKWFQRFHEFAKEHQGMGHPEQVGTFLNKIADDFKKDVIDGYETFAKEIFETLILIILRQNLLNTNDERWKNHLLSMDHLREEVGLAGYAQKKPIDEYRRKAFAMFEDLIAEIANESVRQFFHRSSLPHPRYLFFNFDPQEVVPQQETYSHGEESNAEEPKKHKQKNKSYVSNRNRKRQRVKHQKHSA